MGRKNRNPIGSGKAKAPTVKQAIQASPFVASDEHLAVFKEKVELLGAAWADFEHRLRIKPEVLDHWDRLIADWVEDCDMPLLVRKHRGNRGHRLLHESGRVIIPCDNAAANWVFYQALTGRKPTADELLADLNEARWPLAQVLDEGHDEGATSLKVCAENLNSLGWKVCHVDDIALGGKGPLEQHSLEEMRKHSSKFLTPSNMVLVPKAFGGIGECDTFIGAFRRSKA